jgi:hypothetical protein
MNIHEYKVIVFDFFYLIFNFKYIKVSVPFIIFISLFWILSLRLYYRTKCKFLEDKFSREYIILQSQLVQLRGRQNQITTNELYPTLSTYYGIHQNNYNQASNYNQTSNVVASAPPQYIVAQQDFV